MKITIKQIKVLYWVFAVIFVIILALIIPTEFKIIFYVLCGILGWYSDKLIKYLINKFCN